MFKVSCPICGRVMQGESVSEWPQFPLCSRRCQQIDLGRWLGERYAIAAEEPADSLSADDADIP